jgi:hypothetical protein
MRAAMRGARHRQDQLLPEICQQRAVDILTDILAATFLQDDLIDPPLTCAKRSATWNRRSPPAPPAGPAAILTSVPGAGAIGAGIVSRQMA